MAEKKIKMIVLEGFDRTGKDTLMNMIDVNETLNKKFVCYHQLPVESEHVDYKNPEEFKKFMLSHTRELLDNLYSLSKRSEGKTIVVSRMWMTDDVFSDMYHREHVFRKYFLKELQTNFDVDNYILLFENFDEYKSRCNIIGEDNDFTKDDFDKIYDLFMAYEDTASHNVVNIIKSNTSKEELLEDFKSEYFQ